MTAPKVCAWGNIVYTKCYSNKLYSVEATHGSGFMMKKKLAEADLSQYALAEAFSLNDWLCWGEQDSAWIFLYEMFDCVNDFGLTKQEVERQISLTNSSYLVSVGVEPDPILFDEWINKKVEKVMKEFCHPDLIVNSYIKYGNSLKEQAAVVTCADHSKYLVTKASYDKSGRRLSRCEIIMSYKDIT